MATVDEIIDMNVGNASAFASAAASAIAGINARVRDVGYDTLPLDPNEFDAELERPAADTTPLPTFEAPTPLGAAPRLVDLGSIDEPVLDNAPTIRTNDLFAQRIPSSTMPDWDEAAPDLHINDIYNDLDNLAAPILRDVELPSITPITLRTTPELVLPDYEAPATPDAVPAPTNYADTMLSKYRSALPEMKAFIDDVVAGWIAAYAPEFEEQRSALNQKLMDALDGQVLPDRFESAMYSRAQGRTQSEFFDAEESIFADSKKRGFIVPSGVTTSAINKARLAGANALSAQATDIYIERRKSEIQHLQFVMNTVATQLQSVRSLAVQYAQTGLSVIQQANAQADAIAQKLIVMFEHERSRREFSLALMKALNEQYEVRLKAALSSLEGYKLELQALELKSNVEFKQIEGAKLQIEAQKLQVDRYSAMVEAITKRAVVDELQLKGYSIRADVFKTGIQARLAAFEAYKAAIEGDKAKLQGRLAQLDVFNAKLKSAELKVDVQAKIVDAKAKTNIAKLSQYSSQADVYKTLSAVALQKFTAGAELKKLGLDIYKTNMEANIEAYKGEVEQQKAWVQARIEAFKGEVESLSNYYRLQLGYTEIDLHKTTAIASGYSNMASAALQGLNSTVSQSSTG